MRPTSSRRLSPALQMCVILIAASALVMTSPVSAVNSASSQTIKISGHGGTAFDNAPLAIGFAHACVVRSTGAADCWGEGYSGQLGHGQDQRVWSPVTVSKPSNMNFTSLAAFRYSTCGIMDNGYLYCWGENSHSRLGDGTSDSRNTPGLVSLPPTERVVAVSMGYYHTCAITEDRELWCWGRDSYGELGYEATSVTSNQPFPVQIQAPKNMTVRAVSAGQYFTCIITQVRDVWCTGYNYQGQLGDASSTDRHSFVRTGLPGGYEVISLSSGWAHSCAIIETGDVYCWGRGNNGQLGDGNSTSRTIPIQATLPANRTATSLALGMTHTCALLDDGNVTCWGDNSLNKAPSDLAMPSGRYAVSITADEHHNCMVLDDNSVRCWGYRDQGRMGDGSSSSSSTSNPIEPDGLSTNSTDPGGRDMDGDGFTNILDNCHNGMSSWTSNATTDYDDDGCEDATEDKDDDDDGVPDTSDRCPKGYHWGIDHDEDGCYNQEDADDDDDGLNDSIDMCPSGLLSGHDWDGDGCYDEEDSDGDNDTFANAEDECPFGDLSGTDTDSDGCMNAEDDDDDDDHILDVDDLCPAGTLNWSSGRVTDHDVDGCEDAGEDTDDDNDGLNDTVDLCPLGLLAGSDHDMDGCRDDEDRDDDDDGRDDIEDACPRGMRTGSDKDNDGCTDAEEGVTVGVDVDIDPGENCSTPDEGTDPDGDGCSNDEDYDDDGDGVADADDRCPLGNVGWRSGRITDWDADGCNDQSEDDDDDDDGIADASDACPTGWLRSSDHDLDGCSDDQDPDDDEDGVADLSDACPRGMSTGPDEDGDGCKDNEERTTNVEVGGTNVTSPDVIIEALEEDPDADGDGLRDADDFCPNGRTGWKSGRVLDFDGDGCRDSDEDDDDDDDGVPDSVDACSRTLPGVAMNESGCYSLPETTVIQTTGGNTTTNTTETIEPVTTTESADLASSADLSGAASGSSDTATVVLLVAILVTMLTLLLVVATSRRGGEHEFALAAADEPADNFSPLPQQMDASQLYGQSGPPISATGNVANDGYEWLEHEGQQYYRAPNSAQQWQVWG